MKYRAKAEKVDAIQVRFGKGGWPEWLKGHLAISGGDDIGDGDYLVREGDEVIVYDAEAFADKYERVRERTKGQS